jgi:hypothetical protein
MTTGNPQPQTRPTTRLTQRMTSFASSAAAGAAATALVASLGLAGCGNATAGQQARSDAAVTSPKAKSSPAHAPSPTSSPAPAASVAPGFGTPQDAVDGFYQSELAGNWGAACSYLDPSAQSLCLSGTSGQAAATGSFTVREALIQGSDALVSVTGNICAPGSPCAANTSPSLGMPASASQFQSSYQAAVASSTSSAVTISPMPCTQIGGRWYVEFG